MDSESRLQRRCKKRAVGFCIGSKGYIGTGVSGGYPDYLYYNDFWNMILLLTVGPRKADFDGDGELMRSGLQSATKVMSGQAWMEWSIFLLQ
jgi:hypothetical protein